MQIKRLLRHAIAAAALGALAGAAQAHFQVLHVEETTLQRGENLEFAMVFTHPFPGGPVMSMTTPRAFNLVDRGGQKTDLRKYLKPVEWQAKDNKATAYRASIPKELVRSLGDHTFVLEEEPYLEAEEGLYIQQFTKLIVNVGGVPSHWAEKIEGLPVEIQPLNKPYANWTGGVFSGVVLANGEPVPYAQVEVQYLNHDVDLKKNAFDRKAKVTVSSPAYETLSLYSDAQGKFTIGLPRAGWWGIAALNIGETKKHEGKPLSQDAVLWVQVKDVK